MIFYRQTRRLVDLLLGDTINRALFIPVMALLLIGAFMGDWAWLAWSLAGIWVLFVFWRAWRLFKTGLIDSEPSDWVEPR